MTLPRLRAFLFALPLLSAVALEAQPISLLRPAEGDAVRGAGMATPGRGMKIPRSRLVEVNQDALTMPVAGPRRVALEVFPDTQFVVDELRSYWSADGSTFVWVGQIDGMSRGQVVLAATGDIVSANVTTDSNAFYWIRQVDGRLHSVQQVELQDDVLHDEVVVPPGEPSPDSPDAIADAKNRTPERLATASRDAGTVVIDLMACYTVKAKNAAGGEAAILNKIQLSVAETNQAYVNSSVNIQLNLVHSMQVTYDEMANDIEQALDDFRGTSDGKMDEVHAARNTYGADLVALFIDRVGSAGGTVGIGYLMQTVYTGWASNAFSVNEQYWSTGPGWTLAHELGHNMGSTHDRNNSTNSGAYSYSYGYQRTTSPTFRTIMAYSCSGVSCPKILYFSNPSVSYSGAATGIASGANSADNATSLNNTAATVAAFRATSSGCTYNVTPTSASAAAGAGTGSITVSAGTGCTWTAQTSSSFLSITSGANGSGNGTVGYSVTANSGAARSDTMIIAGQTVTINQSAASCSYSLSPGSASPGAGGGSASVSVSTGAGCPWNASTGTGWINITSGSSGTGSGSVNYTVSSNSGAARNGSMTIAGETFNVSQSGVSSVSITFASIPSGLALTVDGVSVTTPHTVNWQVGTSHPVVAATQGGSTRYAFQSWSQGGSGSQSIIAPSSTTTYTATFATQYLLTASSTPSGSGGLTFVPAYTDGYYNSGVSVQVTATANPGYQFGSWTGSVSGSTSPTTVVMTVPRSITANFNTSNTAVTVTTSPAGRSVTVDGVGYTAPHTFNWQPGSQHTIAAATQGTGTRYNFLSWAHGGAGSQTVTTPGSSVTYTANFGTQYLLTGSAAPSGSGSVSFTPPAGDGYYDANASVQASATANQGYQFSSWSGAAGGSTTPITISMTSQKSITANFTSAAVPVTIATNPTGLSITVDGVGHAAPQTFNWQPGSSHTIGVATQGSGTRYSFLTWSQGGGANQTITTPSSAITYTATFLTQYLLTSSPVPAGNGSVTINPPSGDGYYNSGAGVQLTASPVAGFQFAGWTGAATGTTNPIQLTMNAAKTISASFSPASNNVTINTSPSGLTIVADGIPYAAPKSFQWTTGSTHTIGVASPQQGTGTRYAFANWSDGLGVSHTVTVPAGSATYTASFNASHLLTTAPVPGGGGTISANPVSGDGYYPAGTTVHLTAAPSTGYAFSNWAADLTGTSASNSIVMNAPRTVVANFSTVSTCSYSLSPSSASVLASGDIREVAVSTGACSWTATTASPWITILTGGSGTGNGTVRFNVAANSSASTRTGSITIGNVVHSVVQSGVNCSYTLTGPGGTLSSSGDQVQVSISTQSGCGWAAASTAPWITLPGSASGSGSGAVSVSLAANSGAAARSGAVVIGGQWIHLMQRGTSSASTFNDVASSYMFFDYIGLLGLNAISQGCGGGAYCPEAVMTRAEMAAFIIRALYGETFSYGQTPYFTDAPASHSHFKYIQKMKETGITVGCSATAYCPNDAVTRGQMAVFLVRARLGISNTESFPYPQTPYFSDIPSGHVFFPFIQKMKELGITAGCSATSYCSDSPNTRGQMAVFLVRSFF